VEEGCPKNEGGVVVTPPKFFLPHFTTKPKFGYFRNDKKDERNLAMKIVLNVNPLVKRTWPLNLNPRQRG